MRELSVLKELIDLLKRFPGVGDKTARRLAYFILESSEDYAVQLSESILKVKREIRFCEICGNFSIDSTCEICRDMSRDRSIVCVVEHPMDVMKIEETGYKGLYHVLHGVLSPLDGIGPDKLNIESLIKRVNEDEIREVILSTNLTPEGEATSSYIANLLKGKVKLTRIARGLPAGGLIDYSDEFTLRKALEGRKEMEL